MPLNVFEQTLNKPLLYYIIASLAYYGSFLVIFYFYHENPIGNLKYLESLSTAKELSFPETKDHVIYLFSNFFAYPKLLTYITPIMVLLSFCIPFIYKSLRYINSFALLLLAFFIIGVFIWVKFFSYDYRNALWVKSFLIFSCSIFLNYFLLNYYDKLFIYRKFIIISLAVVVTIIAYKLKYTLGDGFVHKIQSQQQSKIGHVGIAETMVNLVKDKDRCLKIYTNRQLLQYNYYTRDIKDRIISGGWHIPGFMSFVKHECKDGRYFIFGPWTKTRKNTGWEKIEKLEKNGVVIPVNHKPWLIYFVPQRKKDSYAE